MMQREDISRLRSRGPAFRIALIIALAFVWMAFNWTTDQTFESGMNTYLPKAEIEPDIPITYIEKPKPPEPKVEKPSIKIEPVVELEVAIDKESEKIMVEKELEVPMNIKVIKKEKAAPPPKKIEFEPEPDDDEVISFVLVQQKPRFLDNACDKIKNKKEQNACAEKALLEYVYNKIRYPTIARENGISGKAVISFIVGKNGEILEAKILRDPGGGMGKEALRVVNSMPDWLPGKQRDQPVKVQFNLPIDFRLE